MLGPTSVVGRLLDLRGVPPRVVLLTALASYGGLIGAGIAGWPLWALVVAAVLPWGAVFVQEARFTYRHYQWFALFYVLLVTQGGHFVEHLAQMVQLHLLGLEGEAARGIIGQLDTEWVHFGWNTWVLAAVVVLLLRYRDNPWLWLSLVPALWHEAEHAFIMFRVLFLDIDQNAGLLASGGAIAGGLPISRPDLHFLYNVVETFPIVVAFGWQLRRTHDQYLAAALPGATAEDLVAATATARTESYADGSVVIRQGDPADAFYVVTRGRVRVRTRSNDLELTLAELGEGACFGEEGLLTGRPRSADVVADGPVEVLRLGRDQFRAIVEHSEQAESHLARLALSRVRERAATRRPALSGDGRP